jgi:hypothetical protein
MRRASVALTALVVVLFAAPSPVGACGFINDVASMRTWRLEVAESALTVHCTLTNPRGDEDKGSTDCLVHSVLKPHPLLGNKKMLTLPRYLRVDPKTGWRGVIFCEIREGKINPYKGVEVGPAVVDYLKDLLTLDGKDHTRRLRYCFNFLEHPEREIAGDAFNEFMKTPDRELGIAARNLSPWKLRVWLRNTETPSYRLRMYAFLLGNCGGKSDAALLRALLEKLVNGESRPNIDGILTGYTLLAPKDGWAYTCKLLENHPCADGFMIRYSALRAARFFHNIRPDVIGKKDVLEAMRMAVGQEDMADLAIEDLRRWGYWEFTSRILPLYSNTAKMYPPARSAVLRYALQCPGPEAAGFLADRRQREPEFVAQVKKGLEEEAKRSR